MAKNGKKWHTGFFPPPPHIPKGFMWYCDTAVV
jgi:hypothetical protein